MSQNVKIELNSSGIVKLLKSDGVQSIVMATAETVKNRCGSGYESDVHEMPKRIISSVYTAERAAYQDNLDNNTLLRAVNG